MIRRAHMHVGIQISHIYIFKSTAFLQCFLLIDCFSLFTKAFLALYENTFNGKCYQQREEVRHTPVSDPVILPPCWVPLPFLGSELSEPGQHRKKRARTVGGRKDKVQ